MAKAVAETQRKMAAPFPQNGNQNFMVWIPPWAHTLPGFCDWVLSDALPEKQKAAYVEGEVFLDMSQEEIRTHAAVKAEIYRVLFNLNHERDFGDLYPDGVLVVHEKAKVSNNPDGVAVFWESLSKGRVRYLARKGKELIVQGSPDWIIEIVSDSSLVKDSKLLRRAYHRARIPEYWLIDARGDKIDFQILYWRKTGYVAAPNQDGWQHSRAFGCSFRLLRTIDRRGAWKYTFLMQ